MPVRRVRPVVARACAAAALALGLLAAPATSSAGVLDSVSGWWPMYEGGGQVVHDLSGKGNNGQLGSTPGVDDNDPSWIKGWLFGSALRFDGNDFVRVPSSPALSPQKLTVSAWVRASQSPGAWRYIVGKGADGCDAASYGLTTNGDGHLRFYVWNGAEIRSGLVHKDDVFNGKWHHIAGTYDAATAKLYLDGKLVPGGSTVENAAPIDYGLPTSGDVGVGDFLGTCDLFYTGDIDDVAIFNTPLPVDKIWSAISLLFPRPAR
jgi:hypothetical protein